MKTSIEEVFLFRALEQTAKAPFVGPIRRQWEGAQRINSLRSYFSPTDPGSIDEDANSSRSRALEDRL